MVFNVKQGAAESIERYKARLLAKRYTPIYDIDYQDKLSPVAKMNSIRVLISLVATHEWPLLQFDMKNAFLHGDPKE